MNIKAESLNTVVRAAFTMMEKPYLIGFSKNGKYVLGALTSVVWHEGNSLPIFIYVELDNPPEEDYIGYKFDNEGEDVSFVNKTDSWRSHYIPILRLKNPPSIIKV